MDLSDSTSSLNSVFATGELFTEESDATPSITSSCAASPTSSKRKANLASKGHERRTIPAIKRLPPELMLQIFDLLDSKRDEWAFCMACRAFFMAAIENVWFRPNLTDESTLNMFLAVVTTPSKGLTVDYPSFVKRLNLASCAEFVTDRHLIQAVACTSLERLTLVGCSKLTDASLHMLIKVNHNIQSIDISNVPLLTDATLQTIAEFCPRLQGLYATNCEYLTDKGIDQLAKKCTFLKRLKINGCPEMSDVTMQVLTERTQHLVELDVSMCSHITNQHVTSAFTKLPYLREFRLASVSNIDDTPFLHLPDSARFDRLRIVDLTLCHLITDNTVKQLVRVAPKLRNVVLGKCGNITDRSIHFLTSLGRNLQYLHLGHCTQLTDRGINALVKVCTRIQYIDVACCGQLTDFAVRDLATLPKLRRIGLVKCLNITDAAIYSLAQKTGHENTLERIHLSYCAKITIDAILKLVNSCPKLTHLSLTGVHPFIRPDLTQFCRPPPPEFNPHQQALFCVFSGKGVEKLRNYLNETAQQAALEGSGVGPGGRRPWNMPLSLLEDQQPAFELPQTPGGPFGPMNLGPPQTQHPNNTAGAGAATGAGAAIGLQQLAGQFPNLSPVYIREFMGAQANLDYLALVRESELELRGGPPAYMRQPRNMNVPQGTGGRPGAGTTAVAGGGDGGGDGALEFEEDEDMEDLLE